MLGGDSPIAEFRQTRVLLFPLSVLVAAAITFVATANPQIAAQLVVFAFVSLVICIPLAGFGQIRVDGSVLEARGFRTTGTSGTADIGRVIDLDHLVKIHSVGWQWDAPIGVGLAPTRQYLLLEDSDGRKVLIWAWGWTRKRELFDLLRNAALRCNARVDKLTIRRLGIRPA